MNTLLNAFTVDVEDYYQVAAFERNVRRDEWDRWESRVVPNTQRMLALLARHDVKATFFVLGWVAERFPQLVREIHGDGHEIASHGYWHRLIYEQTREEFRADVRQARDVLQDIVGEPVTAYRAPSFSITKQTLWALDILAEEEFRVDASIFPVRHDIYGIPDAPRRLHQIVTTGGLLWEFPGAVARLAGVNLPVGGGGYFRLFPLPLTLYFLSRINRRQRQPFVFYVHPWEIDPQQPRIPGASRRSRFRHYVNLAANEQKLDRLLQRLRFGRLQDVIGQPAAAGQSTETTGHGQATRVCRQSA